MNTHIDEQSIYRPPKITEIRTHTGRRQHIYPAILNGFRRCQDKSSSSLVETTATSTNVVECIRFVENGEEKNMGKRQKESERPR